MESTYVPKVPEEETLTKFWGDMPMCPGKDNIQLVLNNKYYLVGKDKKGTPRQASKGKLSKTEWFEGLEIEERIQAISTIIVENSQILQAIKNDIHKLENKRLSSSGSKTGQGADENDETNPSSQGCSVQNWDVVLPPEVSGCIHEIISKLTFLDTKTPEDTISVQEDLVADPCEFFHTIKTAWEELLNEPEEELTESEQKLHTAWRRTFGSDFNGSSRILCGKILCLIEIAFHNSYSRFVNDKRNFTSKSFLDPAEANWKKTEKIFLEFLDLKEEALNFLQGASSDEASADEFLKTEEALLAYNVPGLLKPAKGCTDEEEIQFYEDIRNMAIKDIKEYRTHLMIMIRPSGDATKGYKIFKNQKELYQILNESRIYQNSRYTDDRVREFAKHLFVTLIKKGDDIMSEQLILDLYEDDNSTKEPVKGRKRKNRNKQSNQQDKEKEKTASLDNNSQNKQQKQKTQKQKQKSKAVTPDKPKNKTLVEEEKKLSDELTATEQSSKIGNEQESLENEKQQEYIDDEANNDAIRDLGKIMLQDSKSECEKEDEYKLEKDLLEDQKAYHDGEKLDLYLFSKKTIDKDQMKVSSLSTKVCEKIDKTATNSGSEEINYGRKEEEKLNPRSSPNSEVNKCISNSSEVVSLHSDEKRLGKVQTSESTKKEQSQKDQTQKKEETRKNKNKKQQQNQNQQAQKDKEALNDQNNGIKNQDLQMNELVTPTLVLQASEFDEWTEVKNKRAYAGEGGKKSSKDSKLTQGKMINRAHQFSNKKLSDKADSSEKHSLRSAGSFKQEPEFSKSKTQNFQTKSNASKSFKASYKDSTGLVQPLCNEETKGESIDGSFSKFQKHANYQTETPSSDRLMQMKMAQESSPASEIPQSLDHNLPAYPYPFGSYHTPQPDYNQINDPTYRQYIYEILIYQKISKQIMDETTNITLYSDLIQKYRIGIKKEIEKVAMEAFGQFHKNVEAHIYGSVAAELALPESDMDLMITGVNSFGSTQAHASNITEMHNAIKEYFDEEILISSVSILNTQVPIIKLKFNLEKYYEIHDAKGDIFVPFINFASTDASGSSLKELAVDISMSDSYEGAHMGLKQNAFVKEKLEQYPVLRPVCLTLKKLLNVNGFNDPYTGGLGSYGLFIMLYAALCFENMNSDEMFQQESTYKGRLFIYFFTMYSPGFDIEKKCIFFFPDGMPIVVDKFGRGPHSNDKLLCVYDPTNNKNNVTSKAFRIKEIQEWFQSIKEKMTCTSQ
ncbi:unnamed protein product [Moneuplotes crassus]|uniref:Poly(A) RNA polymerase mitochondrial-like central palm domain-containing protein n=2 Tax=Euplotes crassus TaxID=5936 RepID=A0AAD1XD00_EUPCR|nr:unnamed protein product [Moneuplotes crassus]